MYWRKANHILQRKILWWVASAHDRLCLTLRLLSSGASDKDLIWLLSSGASYEDLMYGFRISVPTISKLVPEFAGHCTIIWWKNIWVPILHMPMTKCADEFEWQWQWEWKLANEKVATFRCLCVQIKIDK